MNIYEFKRKVKEKSIYESKDFLEYRYSIFIMGEIEKHPDKYTKEEMIKILNPFNQEEMIKMEDMIYKNKHISICEMINTLIEWGYLEWFGGFHFIHKPYTFNLITPIFENGKFIEFNEEILLSKKVADRLQNYCDKRKQADITGL